MPLRPSLPTSLAAIAVLLALAGGGEAVAKGVTTVARQITGAQIKDGSIAKKDLNAALRKQIKKAGKPGPQGPPGTNADEQIIAGNLLTPFLGTNVTLLTIPGLGTMRVTCTAGTPGAVTAQVQMVSSTASLTVANFQVEGESSGAFGTVINGADVPLTVENLPNSATTDRGGSGTLAIHASNPTGPSAVVTWGVITRKAGTDTCVAWAQASVTDSAAQ